MMNYLTPAAAMRPTHSANHPAGYRPDIDGLRSVAIIPVVIFHAFPALLPGGFIGVDVFFVISGFLLTSIVAREIDRGQFSLANFYARRVRRIFPALITTLLATIAIGWFLLLDGEFHQLMWHIFAGATFWQNIALYNEAGYFDRASELKPLLHLWSLAVEEQFYIALPLILLAVARWKGQRAGLIVLTLCAASFALGVETVDRNPEKAFYMPHLRAWELLIGSMIALWPSLISERIRSSLVAIRGRLPASAAHAVGAAGLLAIVAVAFTIDKSDEFPGWVALVPVLGAASIIAVGPSAWTNCVVLSSKPMVYVGLISFPLYLWHWPVLVYLRLAVGAEPPIAYQVAAVAASVALAITTYHLIEKPLRNSRSVRGKLLLVPVLATLMAVLAIFGLAGSYARLDQLRPTLLTENAKNFTWEGAFENTHCRARFDLPQAQFCNLSADKEPTIALIGDSHALVYYEGLAAELSSSGETLLNFGGPSCMPAMRAPFHSTALAFRPNATCPTVMDKAYRIILESDSIHTAVLSGRRFIYALSAEEKAAAHRALDVSIDALQSAGKRVVIVLDFPEPRIDPATCVRPIALIEKASACRIDKKSALADRQSQEDLVRSLVKAHPGVRIHDPFQSLCEEESCPITAEDRSLYRDLDHLSPDGSSLVATGLAKALRSN